MAKEKSEPKIVMERIYTIPLREEWLKTAKYKRAKKAITAIRNFLARHMKIYDGDLNKIKIDGWINRAVWIRGIKHPPHKITIKAVKYDDGTIKAEFSGLPANFKKDEEFLKKKIEKAKSKEQKRKTDKEKRKKDEEKKAKVGDKKEKANEEDKQEDKEKKEKEKMLHTDVSKPQGITKVKEERRDREKVAFRKTLWNKE